MVFFMVLAHVPVSNYIIIIRKYDLFIIEWEWPEFVKH